MTIEHPIVVRLDGTNAEEGRQILAEAAPPNLHVEPTMLDGGAARGGAGRDDRRLVASGREAYRESAAHREGADLDLIVEWAAGARDRARRRDRRRPRRAAAARGRARGRQLATRRPGCSPTSSAGPRTCRSRTAASTSSSCRDRARTTSTDVARGRARDGARRAATVVIVDDNLYVGERVEEAEQLRDPTHVRNYTEEEWRAFFEAAGLEVEEVERFEQAASSSSRGSTRAGCAGEDAERVRELLADRIEDGDSCSTGSLLEEGGARWRSSSTATRSSSSRA